jgi:membrane-associated phospholipid phosphatase
MFSSRLAKYISIISIPPTFSTMAFSILTLTYEHGSPAHRLLVWFIAVLCSGVLQMAYVLTLRSRGTVSAYDVPERIQRTKPYFVSAGISFAGMAVLILLHASVFIWSLMWCYCLNTLITVAINSGWKISAHMMGLTGPVTALIPVIGIGVLWFLPVAIVLGWSRIRLEAHTPAQVCAGAMAGVVLTQVQLIWLLKYGEEMLRSWF